MALGWSIIIERFIEVECNSAQSKYDVRGDNISSVVNFGIVWLTELTHCIKIGLFHFLFVFVFWMCLPVGTLMLPTRGFASLSKHKCCDNIFCSDICKPNINLRQEREIYDELAVFLCSSNYFAALRIYSGHNPNEKYIVWISGVNVILNKECI